jgi:hypothetical protein
MSSNTPVDVVIDNGGVAVHGGSSGEPPALQPQERRGPKAGVYGNSDDGVGVLGESRIPNPNPILGAEVGAAFGTSDGVLGQSAGTAVHGVSFGGTGVMGETTMDRAHCFGFLGGRDPQSRQHAGVYGESDQQGLYGHSPNIRGTGVYGFVEGTQEQDGSPNGFGVRGETTNGVGVQGNSFGGGWAGHFIGTVKIDGSAFVTGRIEVDQDVLITNRGDIAERFPVALSIECEPGMIMVLGDGSDLVPCNRAYDKRVIGVVSGANSSGPAVTLTSHPLNPGPEVAIALVGTVSCKVDADRGAVEVGDVLTTSETPGHAMKATDPIRSFGAVIGKALTPLSRGRGLVSVVISLR